MDTKRRIYLFLLGVVIGSILVYFLILKDRNIYKSPQEIILGRLNAGKLVYTDHAKCRMACRGITEAEVKEVLSKGEVNYKKSEVHDKPCPKYAVEAIVADGTELRIIFGSCDSVIPVITAIDTRLETDTCSCK